MNNYFNLKSPYIFYILLFSLFLKIFIMLICLQNNPNGIWVADTDSYWRPAQALLIHKTFASSKENPNIPETIRTPGYPLFIAIIMGIFGDNQRYIIGAQIILSLFTIFMTYKIGLLIFDSLTSIISAFLISLDITSLVSSQLLLSETLFDFLLILSIWFIIKYIINKSSNYLFIFLSAFFLSCATLVRPITYYYILIFPLIIIFIDKQKTGTWRNSIKIFTFAIIPIITLIFGWQVRNGLKTGNYELSSIQGINLYYYRGAGVLAFKQGINIQDARKKLAKRIQENYPELKGASNAKLSKTLSKQGIKIILKNPFIYFKVHMKGSVNMILNPGNFRLLNLIGIDFSNKSGISLHDEFFSSDLISFMHKFFIQYKTLFITASLAGIYLLLLYIFSIYGITIVFFNKNMIITHFFIFGIVLYLLLISGGPEAHDRLREPVMPMLCLYAGNAITQMVLKLKSKKD